MDGLVDIIGPKIEILENHFLHYMDKRFSFMTRILYNKYFVLNYRPLLNKIFNYYYKNCFEDYSGDGHRLYIKGMKQKN